ncbi:hypothetical protein GCM10007301_29280 [Azorhizobium oxalatiphilum]|uniref:histidine kinase n=1 Tax=Azorhizobium oxalatiphilum TaxID=980631 RepID=A0A917C347_9HYPH|nr:ATP-binding protein [Azorhizobium oxalatiphilum]GGF67707.1 hypothetical protein GCM10007301_29280 [Azorhizobium oxalatiphilum]
MVSFPPDDASQSEQQQLGWLESDRIAALNAYRVLDTPREKQFDDIAELAAAAFDAPIGVVNFIATGRQWFKAEVGVGAPELPLEVSICAHAILQDDLMVVQDTRLDPRFDCNPLVTAENGLRFYAGALLKTADGLPLGTVCVLDRQPRPDGITARQRLTLEVLARQVMTQLELRRTLVEADSRTKALANEVDARKSADAALSRSRERYRSLFMSIDAGFCVIEMKFDERTRPVDYRFVEVNDAFVRNTGLTEAEGKWVRDMVPQHEQHWFDIYGQVAITGEPTRFEHSADALGRYYDVYAFRIGEATDRQVAVMFNDITDRRRTEINLQKLTETLDARVLEVLADREQAHEALRQAQKLEAIGQLTGGVAHDFNNLLTVIRGSAELLRRPDLAEDKRARFVDAIMDTADRAARLTSQLLAFARRQALKPELFDVGEGLEAIGEMISALVGSRIKVKLDLCQDCFILADRTQLDTTIMNLASNARDAMGGCGSLTIATRREDRIPALRTHPPIEGDYVAISIKDTGTGIPAEVIDRIFEPFFTTKNIGEGTGLGLSQVIGFAKQSGGDVEVETSEENGTTFTIYLPRSTVGERKVGPKDRKLISSDKISANVLIVEDNPEVGSFAEQAVRELGYGAELVSDGREALRLIAADPSRFQIVFSDVMMPEMTGIELAEELGRTYRTLPVVLTSGYSRALSETRRQSFDLIHKPYTIEDLASALRRALAKQSN